MTSVSHIPSAILAISAIFYASIAGAQSTESFPGMPVDSATLRVQNQAEEVYERTDYKRAFRIYRNELVPIGDKWAQYNVGFMYLTGKGVEEDRIAASAWYRLAAEREDDVLVRARNQIMKSLDDEQRTESDRQFIELRKQYGDLALLIREIRKDFEVLDSRTGSRVSGGSTPSSVLELDASGGIRAGADYYGRVERRMKSRLEYVANHVDLDAIDVEIGRLSESDIEALERQIELQMSQVP